MINKRILGNQGERTAECYLKQHGASIIERNMRCPEGEIDLIARMDGYLCFVEVKSRSTGAYGRPAEAVNVAKRRHIVRSAQWYIKAKKLGDERIRFDIVEVMPDEIRHLPAAFRADE